MPLRVVRVLWLEDPAARLQVSEPAGLDAYCIELQPR